MFHRDALGRLAAIFLFTFAVAAGTAAAQDQIVFFVRHAEKAAAQPGRGTEHAMMADNPPLSAAGNARAVRLAHALASAGVEHIFITQYQRTRQTAEPLAQARHVTPVMADAKDIDAWAAAIAKTPGTSLVVGHSNTIAPLLKKLGVKETVTVAEQDYDDLFVLVRHGQAPPTLIELHY